MEVTGTPFTVADYCRALTRREILVNHDYQRSSKVWPDAAKSFLIETILLGYPMPKLSLFQKTDVKSRQTIKEIVDGQQRSMALLEFYENKLRLSPRLTVGAAAGKTYSELDEEWQHKFLSYSLSVDLFVNATSEDILEVFRRMNSYTVPLNAEEQRHSLFQGEFKWFVYRQCRQYSKAFSTIGAFTERQLNRMQDAKLLSEVCHAIFHGITTTKAPDLNRLYARFDKEFPQSTDIEKRVGSAMDFVMETEAIHKGPLVRPYQLYSLFLAIMHFRSPVEMLVPLYQPESNPRKAFRGGHVVRNLTALAASIEDPDDYPQYAEFVAASAEKTNVASQRSIRFVWYCRAFDDALG